MNAYIKLSNNFTIAYVYDEAGNSFELPVSKDLLFTIGGYRYDNVYIWDAPEIFAIIDAYALNNNLMDYEQLPLNSQGYKPRVTSECVSRRDSDGGYYERKIWLKTQKIHSIDRHKRLGATTYINVHNFFGSITFKDACEAFEVKAGGLNLGYYLYLVMNNFTKSIKEITGLKLFDENGKLKFWTMGGISKAYYLKLFEKYKEGIPYSIYIPQNKEFEYDMRLTHLLSKGILYCRGFNMVYCNQIKYDKNSLFPHNSQDCPLIYPPILSSWNEFLETRKKKRNNEIYIITFNRLLLRVKSLYPNVLQADGERCSDKNPPILEYINKSFFDEHLETILKIYDVIDIDIKEVYKCKTEGDPAILEFNQTLFSIKKSLNGQSARRSVVKLLLNNLHGKFAQICLTPNFEYYADNNGILMRKIKSLKDTWGPSHFDYLRGAYIYSMSQKEMLEELIKLPHPHQVNYIDTDCFVVSSNNAPRNIGDELGQFKKEDAYNEVVFYAPKTYIGLINGELKVTCAGLNAKEIKEFLTPNLPNTYFDFTELTNSFCNVPTTFTRRTREGFKRVTEWRTITAGLTDKEINEGDYINATD